MLRYEVTFVPTEFGKPRLYFQGNYGAALRRFIEWRGRKDCQHVFILDRTKKGGLGEVVESWERVRL